MNNLFFALNAVLPLFFIVIAGSVIRNLGWIKSESVPVLNKLCFYVLLPCMLFKSASQADLGLLSNPWMYVYGIGGFVVAVLIMVAITPRFIKNKSMAGAFIHGAFRANSVLIGIPLAINMFGESDSFEIVLLCMLLGPVFNIMAITLLAHFSSQEGHRGWKHMLRDIVMNPLVISVALGLGFSFFHIQLPQIFTDPVFSLAAAAPPVAMLCIGASFELKRLVADIRMVVGATLIRIIVMPLIFTSLAVLLGFRGAALGAIYIVYAAPTAATSGIVTEIMGCDGQLGNEIILVSTAASIFTLVAGISILQALALL